MRMMIAGLIGLTLLSACAGARGEISSACMNGGRSQANPRLCSCVQQVANQTLTPSERSRAAGFFADPDKAQETRTSSSQRDKTFWQRYRAFSTAAESRC